MTTLFTLALVAYIAALVCGAVHLVSRRRLPEALNLLLVGAGAALQLAYMALRWAEAGRPPFSNMFESLVLFAWTVAAAYLVLRAWVRIAWLGTAAAALCALTLAHAGTFESRIQPLMPALQSHWMTFHVITCFLGYGAFALSFLAGIGYLAADLRRTPNPAAARTLAALESVMTRTVAFGFLFLTLGILTGAVWANAAWGTYWSWDPKETWSLATWFIYAVFLHCRHVRGWRGRRAAWLAIVGFISVLFTYYGVNFLLAGLHSYA